MSAWSPETADDGLVLSRHPSHSAAAHAAHTVHAHTFAWVTTLDGVTLRHRHGRRPKAPAWSDPSTDAGKVPA